MPKIKIKPQKVSDAERFFEILNNPSFVFISTRPKSLKEERKWLRGSAKRRRENISHNYSIIYGSKLVGGIGVKINYHRNYVGEIGYFIDENYWGKGIASRSVKLVEAIGFKKLKLVRLEIVMQPANKASEKVAIKNGYRKEGLMKKAVKGADNKYEDRYLYAKVM